MSNEQHSGLRLLCGVDHRQQVFAQGGDRQATQTVVTAQGDDDDLRGLSGECAGQSGATTAQGFPRDAGVDDLIIELFLLQTFFQQRGPGAFLGNAVACRKRIAQDENFS